ncbi:MAG: DUF4261 domain-containing protein [Fimbriiglobus sp.]
MSVPLLFVTLNPQAKVNSKAIAATFGEMFSGYSAKPTKCEQSGMVSFEVNGQHEFILALMPVAIPDIEPLIGNSMLWRNSEKHVPKHTGHLIVTMISQDKKIRDLESTKLITMAVAATLKACPGASGVYVGWANMLVEREIYIEMAEKFLPDGMPLFIWVNVFAGSKNGKTAGHTLGLKQFGHMEFESHNAHDNVGQFRERLYNLVEYVMDNGPVIKDGNTVGADENEKIVVEYAPSEFGLEDEVMMLDYRRVKRR